MPGKRKWAHREPKKKAKRGKQARFYAKQREHRDRVNANVTRQRAEIEQLAQS